MAEVEFKLPGSSFQEIAKIIQAYAQISKPASLEDVSRRSGTNTTTISGNNGFLLSLGIIEGGKSKTATILGKRLGDALGHSLEDETRLLLRQIVEQSDFLKGVIGAIRIRKGMEESALRAHIAYSAGAGKSPSVTTGAGAVVELLLRSGAILEEDGKFTVASASFEAMSPAESTSVAPQTTNSRVVERIQPLDAIVDRDIKLSIEVRINCTPAELEGLGDQLRTIVEQFRRSEVAGG